MIIILSLFFPGNSWERTHLDAWFGEVASPVLVSNVDIRDILSELGVALSCPSFLSSYSEDSFQFSHACQRDRYVRNSK